MLTYIYHILTKSDDVICVRAPSIEYALIFKGFTPSEVRSWYKS